MELSKRLLAYIEKHFPVSDETLMRIANSKGFTQSEVYNALEVVGRDRSITTKVRGSAIWYTMFIAPIAKPALVLPPYPWPENFVMPFPEIDMSYIFLKTKEERDAYKAEASGRPLHMLKKHYVNARG